MFDARGNDVSTPRRLIKNDAQGYPLPRWHKNGETASEKGCEWVAMFPEKRCLVKGCMDMGQEGAEGTDCPAEKYTACDGCMTTCAGQMVCGGTGDDGKKPSGDDRK